MNSFADFLKRYAEKIDFRPDGCWFWKGSLSGQMGYGNLWNPSTKKMQRAHRAAYEAMFGPIPDGMCACHTCDNPRCMNPHHIFLGTQKENIADMFAKGRARHQKPTIEKETT